MEVDNIYCDAQLSQEQKEKVVLRIEMEGSESTQTRLVISGVKIIRHAQRDA